MLFGMNEVSNALKARLKNSATIIHWPPILKVRQGLNRGANIRIEGMKVEAAPRSYMDDNAGKIVKITGAACAFLGLGLAILYFNWATSDLSAETTARQSGNMFRAGAGMCVIWMAVSGIAGSIAAMIATAVIGSHAEIQANRKWARDLEEWLNATLNKPAALAAPPVPPVVPLVSPAPPPAGKTSIQSRKGFE